MEFMHRVIAAVATLFLLVLCRKRFRDYRGLAKAVPLAVIGIVAAEIAIGGLVVLLELPVQLTTVHFMTGLIVFLLVFYMMSFDGVKEAAGFSLRHFAVFSLPWEFSCFRKQLWELMSAIHRQGGLS
jgi:hypothetical protein